MALVVVVPMGAAGVVAELDGDVLDPGFAGILDAVGVGVIPDEVAEGGALIEARIQGDVIFPGGEGGGGGGAGGGIGVRVHGIVTARDSGG